MITLLRHLVRRTIESIGSHEPSSCDAVWVRSLLTDEEHDLWDRLHPRDRRHSVGVARRFVQLAPSAPDTAVAGALLHDIGKVDAPSSVVVRILTKVCGPRTSSMRRLTEHEQHGLELLHQVDADPLTIATASGCGPWGPALLRADHL
jgi:response regulator RpfG family c-di-GMP phosphodiesterase